MSEKYCEFCGASNDLEASFCRNKECGGNLSLTKDSSTLDQMMQKTKKNITKNNEKKATTSIKEKDSNIEQDVNIKDIDMPFESMVVFIFKWTIASIPTIIFIYFIWFLILKIID